MMCFRAVVSLILLTGLGSVEASVKNKYSENGVSLALADLRIRQIEDVVYSLHFRIPANMDQSVSGDETIQFTWIPSRDPLWVDARVSETRGFAVSDLSVNGKSVELKLVNGHIEISPALLTKGKNSLKLKFVAGAGGLRRFPDYMYTLFVPDLASKTFPCFDQPNIKAIYNLVLDIPKNWVAVSQGQKVSEVVQGETKTIAFSPTKPTSSYLFAFAAGDFHSVERQLGKYKVKMYYRESDEKKVQRNLDEVFKLHEKAIAWMEDYTGISYPFEKFDFVALPGFTFGGMEHPGSIFYVDKLIFLDESATQLELLRRASTIAHEVSHMWFGDLVTMKWFDDVWLKEVFANFMAAKIVSPSFPELDHDLRFLLTHYPSAYSVDRTQGANSVRQKLLNLADAATVYGEIIYYKAPILMRELERLLGPADFQKSLRDYLEHFKWKSAAWPDLWNQMLPRLPASAKSWNKAWIETPGRPTLRIRKQRAKGGSVVQIENISPAKAKQLWPQKLSLRVQTSKETAFHEVAIDSSVEKLKLPYSPEQILLITTDYKSPGYGLIELDPDSQKYLMTNLPQAEDEAFKAQGLLLLYENLLEKKVDAESFVILGLEILPTLKKEQVIDYTLRSIGDFYWTLLSEDVRNKISPRLEALLWKQLDNKYLSSLSRSSYLKSLISLFTSDGTWTQLQAILNKTRVIEGVNLSESDYMNLAYALSLRKPEQADRLYKDLLVKIKDDDRKKEFSFIMRGIVGQKELFFQELLKPEGRVQEPWVLKALSLLHHPLQGRNSEKFLPLSLEVLPALSKTSGIFFPKDWLVANFQSHVNPQVKEVVKDYLAANKSMEPGLKSKILQATDLIYRFGN